MILSDSTKHSYRSFDLNRCLKKDDFWKYRLSKDGLNDVFENISHDVFSPGCGLEFSFGELYGKKIYCADNFCTQIILRQTCRILKKTLHIYPFNRDQEAYQVINVIKNEGKDSVILKTDIKSFFETIVFESVIDKLKLKGFKNRAVFSVLNELVSFLKNDGYVGLPRGLALSSILAEYYLDGFDKFVTGLPFISYYGRYVDDIIIVYKKDTKIDIKNEVSNYLFEKWLNMCFRVLIPAAAKVRNVRLLAPVS